MDPFWCSIACWNVGGLGGKHKKYLVMNWIKSLPTPPWVIGLHELKSSPFITKVAMNTIAPDYSRVILKADARKGGTTSLLFHPSLTLVSFGTLSHGQAAWTQLKHDSHTISIAVVYAPSDSTRARALLWHQLKGLLLDGQWIICRDFNMSENPLDSSGPPLVSGRQKEAWRLLKTRLDLVDAFTLPRTFIGTIFTCRAIHRHGMDQSQIDRFYIGEKTHWLHAILKLEHVQTQALSDHYAIILTVQIAPPPPLNHTREKIYILQSLTKHTENRGDTRCSTRGLE